MDSARPPPFRIFSGKKNSFFWIPPLKATKSCLSVAGKLLCRWQNLQGGRCKSRRADIHKNLTPLAVFWFHSFSCVLVQLFWKKTSLVCDSFSDCFSCIQFHSFSLKRYSQNFYFFHYVSVSVFQRWFCNFVGVSLPKSFWPTVKHKTFHIARTHPLYRVTHTQ